MKSFKSLNVILVLLGLCLRLTTARPQDVKVEIRHPEELTEATIVGESKVYGLISNESEGKEAKLEKEDFDSKILSFFDNIQKKVSDFTKVDPVVDKAKPEDYEKNPIEDYEGLRNGIVQVVDFLAKQLNSALEAPQKLYKKTNKAITKSLNDLGNKLVGLE
ncbi:uncharacterized protein LOC129757228 [Uranotaenia lowii]|uniref:uncharacterized protein LOC129757228 n=1 Tax=Uranotaenia lowii TaxID=190385 RepID=UPI002478661F|nr:uncharacterized protein LOC129757228 [Uranotaenia lowii]